ncbi:MAG TPA: hypothetical protein VK633_00050 [Verrucomicrobiae bacterium]|nr:hypothetical protein [Verrucomicrobiae bacterium]
MRKKVLGMLGLLGLCSVLTGCNAIQGYSVRSYQGPLPIADYQFINQDAYGVPTATR